MSEPNIEIFCLHDLQRAPAAFREINSDDDAECLCTCSFEKEGDIDQLMIFTQGQWTEDFHNSEIVVNVLCGRKKKQKICTLSNSQRCFQWLKCNSSNDLAKVFDSNKITLEAIISNTRITKNVQSEEKTPVVTNLMEEREDMKELNETTPLMETSNQILTPKPAKLSKKRGWEEEGTPKPKSRRQRKAMRALSAEKTPPAKTKLGELCSTNNDTAVDNPAMKELSKEGKLTRCVDLSARAPKPSSRWGHTMTLVNSKQAVLIGGQGEKQLSRDSIWILDPETRTWKCPDVKTEGIKPEYRIGHSATYDPTMRCIYVYGGSKNTKWFNDVHMFDLDEKKWTLVKANGKAPTRAYHSATLYRHELWIFGGVFPRPDPQPDGCDNDINIFSPVMENWYKPIVTGEKPQPRSGHSATLINDLLVVFGGWDFPFCYNDLFILDLTTVDWSSPKVWGCPPKPRSWHASCALASNRVFIHGGYDGDNPLHDAFIFDLESKSWQELALTNAPSARAGHACLRLYFDYENQEEDEVLVFGGGDNDGSYYSDMLSFYVPYRPRIVDNSE